MYSNMTQYPFASKILMAGFAYLKIPDLNWSKSLTLGYTLNIKD